MIQGLQTRLRYLFRPKPADELDEEVRLHIEESTEAKIAGGMAREEARRQALIEFGGVEAVREQAYEVRPGILLETIWQDVRFSGRILWKDKGFTAIALLILGLGIGVNVVAFSLVETILLRPLPFSDPSQLVWLQPVKEMGKGRSSATYSVDALEDLRSMNHSFEAITGYYAFSAPENLRLTGSGQPLPVTGIPVLGNFFHELGVKPELGRDFTAAESQTGAGPVVLLSHGFWERQFHGDRSIVGKAIDLDDAPVTVVGVLPASFDFGAIFSPGSKVDVYTPQLLEDIRNDGNTVTMIGRLKPGVTLEQAEEETRILFPKLYWSRKEPRSLGAYGQGRPIPLKEHVSGTLRRSLNLLWAAVGLIMLIVCVNLSNLVTVRAAARAKEFALRMALGASRARVLRQLLTESALLSCAGTVLGLGIAFAATAWLAHQGSVALPLLSMLRVDGRVLLWTMLIALVTSVLIGLGPAMKMTGNDLQQALQDTGTGTSEGRRNEALRSTLVISEVALACVLIVSAGLLLRSFLQVLDVDLGFRPDAAAAIHMDYDRSMKVEQRMAFFQNALREVMAIPGVEVAGISDNLPLARNRSWGAPGVKGVDYPRGSRPETFVYMVSPGYLPAMGIGMQGRDFGWQDDGKSEKVAVLNQSAAQFLFPGQDAVGRMVMFSDTAVRIIGVTKNVHETAVETGSSWQMYLPAAQGWDEAGAQLVVRSRLPAAALGPAILSRLRSLNAGQPSADLLPIQGLVDHATSPRRFFALLVAVFAALGLFLASLGIYGVISYGVTRQTREIGIRMALGASRLSVQLQVIGKTLRLTLTGIAIGTAVSYAVGTAMQSLLFGTRPTDEVTFLVMALLLTLVAVVAGYLPARRASRIDPMIALRSS
jgi:predicted permease